MEHSAPAQLCLQAHSTQHQASEPRLGFPSAPSWAEIGNTVWWTQLQLLYVEVSLFALITPEAEAGMAICLFQFVHAAITFKTKQNDHTLVVNHNGSSSPETWKIVAIRRLLLTAFCLLLMLWYLLMSWHLPAPCHKSSYKKVPERKNPNTQCCTAAKPVKNKLVWAKEIVTHNDKTKCHQRDEAKHSCHMNPKHIISIFHPGSQRRIRSQHTKYQSH